MRPIGRKVSVEHGLAERASPMSVRIRGFHYNFLGEQGFCPEQVLSVMDSVNYIFMDENKTLQSTVGGYPSAPHIRLAEVTVEQGQIRNIDDTRPFLAALPAGGGGSSDTGWEKDTSPALVHLSTDGDPVTIGAGDTIPEQQLRVVGTDPAKVPLIIEGAPGQSAELLRVGNLTVENDGKEVRLPDSGASPSQEGAVAFNSPSLEYHDGTSAKTLATTDYVDSSATPPWKEDEFVASNGQVTFILSQAPSDLASLSLYVNGIVYDDDDNYTVSGTTVTWLNDPFSMDAGDKLLVRYI